MNTRLLARTCLLTGGLLAVGASSGCILAAAGAAGAAGGYEANKHGYGVQSPVKKDAVGGYKGQSPVVHNSAQDSTQSGSQTGGKGS